VHLRRSGRSRSSISRVGPFLALLLPLIAVLVVPPVLDAEAADTATPLEHQVKAAFLFNFARFVEWPPDSPGESGDGFVLCVADDDYFAAALDQAVSGKSVDGLMLRVRRLQPLDDVRACRILYIGTGDPVRLETLLKSVRTVPVLTVAAAPGFTRRGGIINFILEDNRLRFEINPDAAQRAGLQISSKLLQLATIVHDTRKAENER